MSGPARWVKQATIVIFYGLLVFIMTTPASFSLSSALIGNNVDNWIFYWNNWWLAKALQADLNPLRTPYMYFPNGASLVAHSNSFSNSLAALLITPVIGPVAAYNLVLLSGLWLGALGTFYLVRDLTDSYLGALIAGTVFAFAPYHLTQVMSHAHLGSIHWWPYCALFLHRTLDHRRWQSALALGTVLACTLWTGLQLAVMITLWMVLYVIWWGLQQRKTPLLTRRSVCAIAARDTGRGVCLRLLLAAMVILILGAPVLIPVAAEWNRAWTDDFDWSTRDQTDLLAYLVPPTYNPFIGRQVVSVYERFVSNRAYMPYLGLGAVLLALFSLSGDRRSSFWLVSFGIWIILAAGSVPRINGVVYSDVALPYRWIADRFPFSTLRAPDRMNLLMVFTLAVLVGYGASRIRYRWLGLMLGLIVMAEYIPVPLLRWDLPPTSSFYDTIAHETSDYGVVDVPMGYDWSKLWLYYQTQHGKPTVEGHVSRYTPEIYSLITSNPILRALYKVSIEAKPSLVPAEPFQEQDVPISDLGPAIRELTRNGVRYILVHRPYLDPTATNLIEEILPFVPVFRDDYLTVYDLTAPLLALYDDMPVSLTSTVTLVRFAAEHEFDTTWRLTLLARADSAKVSSVSCDVALVRDDRPVLHVTTELFVPPSDGRLWMAKDLDYQVIEVTLDTRFPEGRYVWALSCDDEGQTYRYPSWLAVDTSGNIAHWRRTADVIFHNTIRLEGYDWKVEGANLELTLIWETSAVIDDEYLVFVHLMDDAGHLWSQYDAVPCEWSCPTQTWLPGQPITDYAILDLIDVPPGDYTLVVGLYDPLSMARLDAETGDGAILEAKCFELPDTFTVHEGAIP